MSMSREKLSIDNITLFVIVFYVVVQVLSNISSTKIANVFSLAVDGGTFLYPLAFTLRDLIHKRLGKSTTQSLIIISAVINIFTPIFFFMVAKLPPDSSWAYNQDFANILSPVIRISLASIAAGVVAEFIDTEVYHLFVTRITKKYQWLRVLLSNSVSVPIDTLIFTAIAFLGVLDSKIIFDIIIFNCVVKYSVSVLSIPLIYMVKEKENN